MEVKTMATIEQLVKQYETDKELQAEVAAILSDGKVSMMEFMQFAKKHNVAISLDELPMYLEQAKKLGFM
jgi:predicted transcriptional regulator